jgi:hypothetical protein
MVRKLFKRPETDVPDKSGQKKSTTAGANFKVGSNKCLIDIVVSLLVLNE